MATDSDVRRICRSLPGTSELISAGAPYFRVGRHGFAKLRNDLGAVVVWTADIAAKEALLRAGPDKFFSTPHYDGERTVLVRLAAIDVDELTDLLADSWRLKAPAELRDTLDRPDGDGKEWRHGRPQRGPLRTGGG